MLNRDKVVAGVTKVLKLTTWLMALSIVLMIGLIILAGLFKVLMIILAS